MHANDDREKKKKSEAWKIDGTYASIIQSRVRQSIIEDPLYSLSIPHLLKERVISFSLLYTDFRARANRSTHGSLFTR